MTTPFHTARKSLSRIQGLFYDWMKGGESRHFYNVTKEEGNIIEADWVVSAKLADGNVMTLAGHNVMSSMKTIA